MRTAVIILNWNTKQLLSDFLPGLLKSCEGRDAELVVADNGSTDGSVDLIRKEFPAVEVIELDNNYGFTGGYNRAVDILMDTPDAPEYIVLMNSDIDVPEGWLEPLVSYMDSHADCGVVAPKLHALDRAEDGYVRSDRFEYAGAAGGFLDRFGYPYCRGRVLNDIEQDRGQYDSHEDLLWVSGACLMTRASLWKQMGGLDKRFFAHMEEIDYCWRLNLQGWKVAVVPESVVWHLGGATLSQGSPFKLTLNYRNSIMMLRKNLPATVGCLNAALIIALRHLFDLGAMLVYLFTGKFSYARAVVTSKTDLLFSGKEERTLRVGELDKNIDWIRRMRVCILLRYFK